MIDYNGKLYSQKNPILHVNNRAYNYGDGLFETMRFVKNNIVFSEDHFYRLLQGMKLLKMKIPEYFKIAYFEEQIRKLVKANNFSQEGFRVKLVVFREAEGLYNPINQSTSYVLRLTELDSNLYLYSQKPYHVGLFSEHRVLSGKLSNIKTTNRLLNVLAGIYAEENAWNNCLLLNEKEEIVEATNGNVFFVKNGTYNTPALSRGCISGITRKMILEILKKTNQYITEKPIKLEDVIAADEMWITNSIMGVRAVTHFQNKKYRADFAQKMIEKLNEKSVY